MPKKGQKSTKGVGDLYAVPKVRTNIALTPDAQELLDLQAQQLGISRSELIERFARGMIAPPGHLTREDKEDITKSA